MDYHDYTPPGRLGREVARLFVGMGTRGGTLSVCSMATASAVIRSYVEHFDAAPPLLNLLEVPAPTRGELADRLKAIRPDLRFIWMPMPVLRVLSGTLKIVLRIMRPKAQALDVYAAFKSEAYDTTLASKIIDSLRLRSNPDSRPLSS